MFHVRPARPDKLLAMLKIWVADIANYIFEHPGALDLSLKGFWISDRKCSRVSDLRKRLYALFNSFHRVGRHSARDASCQFRTQIWERFRIKVSVFIYIVSVLKLVTITQVRRLWHNWMLGQVNAGIHRILTNTSHIRRRVFFPCPVIQREEIEAVGFGTKSLMPRYW